ncbi:MAG: hypothetical protein JWN56_554 [Sphingobacteriales bacterium]|nr:hypothetical protein [Sphingobacteriales bacterium]
MCRLAILSLLFILLATGFSSAQTVVEIERWSRIEKYIRIDSNLISLSKEVEKIRVDAAKSGNDLDHARTLYYQMLIKGRRTEDTLYFKNSAFIDSILMAPSAPGALKSLMHIMQAKRLIDFDKKYLRFRKDKYEIKNLPYNYAKLSASAIDSIIKGHFTEALKEKGSEFKHNRNLLWLSSNEDVFLFDPSLTDIVWVELIDYSLRKGVNLDIPADRLSALITQPATPFFNVVDSLATKSTPNYPTIKAYKKWLESSKADFKKHAFIETLLLKYLFLSHQTDSAVLAAYKKYLYECTISPVDMVKAHGVYQLCLLLYKEGLLYESTRDVKYKHLMKELLMLYDKNRELINTFSSFKPVLSKLERGITQTKLKLEMVNAALPGQPMLLSISYKNVKTVYYRIIHKNVFNKVLTENPYNKLPLFRIKPLVTDSIALPANQDYNGHAAYGKLNELPFGDYYLLFSTEKDGAADDDKMGYLPFVVSNLVPVYTDNKVFILDRKTGVPVVGAEVQGFLKNYTNPEPSLRTGKLIERHFIGIGGYALINSDTINTLKVIFKGDTIEENFFVQKQSQQSQPDELFNKEEYDDLVEYHDDQVRMHIFTDRSIYRPGQTVFYKAIVLTRNPKTGEMMLFNKRQLKSGMFNNVYKKWLLENEPVLFVSDPMNRKTDSVKLTTDNYGSFSGSFVIPKAATTGEWSIESDYIEVDDANYGSFQVEEYKRPTFEITIEKPKKMLLPGDDFSLKFKVKSFTGTALNGLPVKYRIERNGYTPSSNYSSNVLADSTLTTDEKGELTVTITDTLLKRLKLLDKITGNYTYSIDVDVKDATGESVELEESFSVSSHPITINIQTSSIYDRALINPSNVSTVAENEGTVSKTVKIKVYRILSRKKVEMYRYGYVQPFLPDEWIYSKDDLQKWFPYHHFSSTPEVDKKELAYETSVNTTTYEKLVLDQSKLTAGEYEIEASVEGNGQIIGITNRTFKVFDSQNKSIPAKATDFSYVKSTSVKTGENIKLYTGSSIGGVSIYHLNYATKNKGGVTYKQQYFFKNEESGLNEFEFKVPDNVYEQLVLTKINVRNNEVNRTEERFFIPIAESVNPEIVIESYRKVLVPGAAATFTVSVKTKNRNTAVQLMSTMYDASLEKLEKHRWKTPEMVNTGFFRLNAHWTQTVHSTVSGAISTLPKEFFQDNAVLDVGQALQGRAAGVSVTYQNSSLNEIVVVSYESQRMYGVTGASNTIRIRGTTSLADYKQPLIIVDGVVYAGDLSSLSPTGISEMMVLKGADASAIYGARAANGVLVISTKGPIVLPEGDAPEPAIKIRKNFNETAFFYPKVYAGTDGFYTLTFTMPESVTAWNWKMLAHTKDARFAYTERTINTQLNLMVQPHMPRLLYQGDKINLQSRISNMDTTAVKGTITCLVEDAITGQDLTSMVLADHEKAFSADKKLSTYTGFLLSVPANQMNPLKVVIKAATGSKADAEEHIIPVFSTKVFIDKVVPIALKSKEETIFKNMGLPADAEVYGLGVSVKQMPQAALINSLTWLASYSFNCAEQTFNKLSANVTALNIMRYDKTVQSLYQKAKEDVTKENTTVQKLPTELESMELPWLKLAGKRAEQQKQLFNLLDTVKTNEKIDLFLARLYQLQNAGGGIAWFDGGNSSSYISKYILAGFGRIKNDGWKPASKNQVKHQDFVDKLLYYCKSENKDAANPIIENYTLYALSYWKGKNDFSTGDLDRIKNSLKQHWSAINRLPLSDQALLITATYRFTISSDPLRIRAKQQLSSIRELAIEDAQNGIRWKAISDYDNLNTSAEETLAFLAEAFDEEAKDKTVKPGILKWIFSAKPEEGWRTTKGTAAAIKLLTDEKGTVMSEASSISLIDGDQTVSVSNDLFKGNTSAFVKTDLKANPVIKNLTDQPSKAAANVYYFTSAQNLDSLNRQVKLSKKMYYHDKEKGLQPVKAGQVLKAGEKVTVVLSITADKPLKFVYLDDKRAAAFEPVENKSEYKYQDGIGFYLSVRDTGLQLFAESVPSGTSNISYELQVSQEGTFFIGPAVLQCMYNPDIISYSNTGNVSAGK